MYWVWYSYSEDQQLENIEKEGTWMSPFEEEDRMWMSPFADECKGIDQLEEYTLCVENAKYTPWSIAKYTKLVTRYMKNTHNVCGLELIVLLIK